MRISCRGVACHSGYPHLGQSAIDPIVEVLHALKHHAWPSSEELGETTLNIGMVEGGQAANALAESSEAVAMFRLIGAPQEVLEVVEAVATEHGCLIEVNGECLFFLLAGSLFVRSFHLFFPPPLELQLSFFAGANSIKCGMLFLQQCFV